VILSFFSALELTPEFYEYSQQQKTDEFKEKYKKKLTKNGKMVR